VDALTSWYDCGALCEFAAWWNRGIVNGFRSLAAVQPPEDALLLQKVQSRARPLPVI
jgi:hypothetical protein